MKIVWKKISEDDPIFKTWFIVSPIKKNPTKKQETRSKKEKDKLTDISIKKNNFSLMLTF